MDRNEEIKYIISMLLNDIAIQISKDEGSVMSKAKRVMNQSDLLKEYYEELHSNRS